MLPHPSQASLGRVLIESPGLLSSGVQNGHGNAFTGGNTYGQTEKLKERVKQPEPAASQKPTKAKNQPQNPKKDQPAAKRAKAKGQVEVEDDECDKEGPRMTSQKATQGRTKGAKMYGTSELVKLVELTKAMLPLAGKGWTVVAEKYNKWAAKHNLPNCKTKALQNKFDVILNQAKDKPTGKGERRQMYFDALEAEKLIDKKLQMTLVQDHNLGFLDSSSDNKGGKDSSDSNNDVQLISARLTTKKGTVLTKSYKTEAALPNCAASR
ncbi:hypothetical protein BT96DRAFT_940554 [Gymnopus androsaceus JB14]|uniref:Uncharacterized protein n=1 Tax=Gymnopus androsaceus JB14 TaxID=1447944 RepID=A0A6A4HKC7_9AGAR|nr:hypothetical protein BT96DRAFT_940554 [Gymnopus androsaceus JB14]